MVGIGWRRRDDQSLETGQGLGGILAPAHHSMRDVGILIFDA